MLKSPWYGVASPIIIQVLKIVSIITLGFMKSLEHPGSSRFKKAKLTKCKTVI